MIREFVNNSLMSRIKFGLTLLALIARPRRSPVVVGFYLGSGHRFFLKTLRPGARVIRMDYFRGDRSPAFSGKRAKSKLRLLRSFLPDDHVCVIWGFDDWKIQGFSMAAFFGKTARIGVGMSQNLPPRHFLTRLDRAEDAIFGDNTEIETGIGRGSMLDNNAGAATPGGFPASVLVDVIVHTETVDGLSDFKTRLGGEVKIILVKGFAKRILNFVKAWYKFARVALKLLSHRSKAPLILTLFHGTAYARHYHTIFPGASIIDVDCFNAIPGFYGVTAMNKVRVLENLSPGNHTWLVWGNQDQVMIGIDFEKVTPRVIRSEMGLLSDIPDHPECVSLILSSKGVFFDGRYPSQFEDSLNSSSSADGENKAKNMSTIAAMIESGVSKYEATDDGVVSLSPYSILIVGQVTGDQAVLSTETICTNNIDLIQHVMTCGDFRGDAEFYYKAHPRNPWRVGENEYIEKTFPNLKIIPPEQNIIPLLEQRPVVATITSGVGLEAALRGCEVHCYGVSFYSNWGFTVDHVPCPRRKANRTALDVAVEIMINQTVYADSSKGRTIQLEEIMNHVSHPNQDG